MTIRRQYQLPNCSLILDGLSIDPTPGNEDVMSLLVNAECRISGLERSLNGGYNFFAALVRAVSQYSQEILSGFAHPQVVEGEPLLVHINPGDGPYHHLVVQPEIADLGESGDGRAIDIKLSAVQLFDLTEAVDQFFDDTQTLPELQTELSPLPRRFVRTEEPLSDRALPVILGAGSLVVATMAVGLLPVPELRDRTNDTALSGDSEEIATTDTTEDEPPTGDGTTPPADSLAAANADSPLWEEAPRIEDPAVVARLQEDLQTQLDENVDAEVSFDDPVAYQVAVNEAGSVVGYQFEDDAALRDVDKTPLNLLVGDNAGKAGLEEEAIAEYNVAFTNDGITVAPLETIVASLPEEEEKEKEEEPNEPAAEPEDQDEVEVAVNPIATEKKKSPSTSRASRNSSSADFDDEPPAVLRSLGEIEILNDQLKRTIVENRDQPRVGKAAASYRVRIEEDGTITAYQPVSPNADKAIDETPLPELVESGSKDAESLDYRVVFTERGVVEVSPWWGWSYYE
ncbi:MAG: DUF4335 domain-containing protein [Phormidesmis sp.]